jgi:hypothetical protein
MSMGPRKRACFFLEAESKFNFNFNSSKPVSGCCWGGSAWVGIRDTPQVPLRGPAQPLAAVRSDACEAMPRKQCVLTRVGSVAPSMALRVPATHPCRPLTLRRCAQESKSSTARTHACALPFSQLAEARTLVLQWNQRIAVLLPVALPGPPANCRGMGWVGSRDPERHGWRDGAYTDVLAACPGYPPPPPPPYLVAGCPFTPPTPAPAWE